MLRQTLLAAIDRHDASDRSLSVRATGSSDTLRNIRRGSQPRIDTAEALFRAMGALLVVVPGAIEAEETEPRLTHFSKSAKVPVITWTAWNHQGHLAHRREAGNAPPPNDCNDPYAFYAQFPCDALRRAGIEANDFCLVSPMGAMAGAERCWAKGQDGREWAGWAVRSRPDAMKVVSWRKGERVVAEIGSGQIAERGPIVGVWRKRPEAGHTQHAQLPWKPEAADTLWHAVEIEKNPEVKEILKQIEGTVERIHELRERGAGGKAQEHQSRWAAAMLQVLVDKVGRTDWRAREGHG